MNSCALGIAVKTYLDELNTRDDPTSEQIRAEMRGKGQEWFPYSEFSNSLDDAFKLWDAVSRKGPNLHNYTHVFIGLQRYFLVWERDQRSHIMGRGGSLACSEKVVMAPRSMRRGCVGASPMF